MTSCIPALLHSKYGHGRTRWNTVDNALLTLLWIQSIEIHINYITHHTFRVTDHESIWDIYLGRLERYPAATKRLWAVREETRRPVHLISSSLILDDERTLFLLMIRIRARSSLDVVILNRCLCGLWIVSRTRRKTLEMPPSEKAHDQTTEQWVQEFQEGYWLAWLPLCFEIEIYT